MVRLLAVPILLALWFVPGSAQTEVVQAVVVDTTGVAPVVVDAETLFVVRAIIHGMSVSSRAEGIARRIADVAETYTIRAQDIVSTHQREATEIYAKDRFVMAVYDVDALLAGTSRDSLGEQYLVAIRNSVDRYRDVRSSKSLLTGVLETLGATAVFVLLLWLLARGALVSGLDSGGPGCRRERGKEGHPP